MNYKMADIRIRARSFQCEGGEYDAKWGYEISFWNVEGTHQLQEIPPLHFCPFETQELAIENSKEAISKVVLPAIKALYCEDENDPHFIDMKDGELKNSLWVQ